jgi:hypothetical protein
MSEDKKRQARDHNEEVPESTNVRSTMDKPDDHGVEVMQVAEHCLQAGAEQAESLEEQAALPAVSELSEAQALAMSPGLQALFNAVLPLIGANPSRPGEFPGVFKVEPGEEEDEALVFLDVPANAYRRGQRGDMARVLALSVKLAHDYRKLGDQYYCIDCETPGEETRH